MNFYPFSMACYSKDVAGNYLFVNAPFLDHAGIKNTNDIIGLTDLECPWSDNASQMQENDQRIIKSEGTQIFLELGVSKGRPKWFRSFKSPFLGRNGKTLGLLGISVPIDEKSLIPLSKQQTVCLKHLACGLTCKQIANELGLSVKTVEHHLSIIKIKLNCHSRAELILQAIERGLIIPF